MKKELIMRYFSPAESTNEGWEMYSLPIGNGYFGASIFGGTDFERIQFTTNAFCNSYSFGGVSNFGEIKINFEHQKANNYERGLLLDTGIAYSRYNVGGIEIEREAFVSYPDKVFAYKITSKEATIDFSAELVIPYLNARPIDKGGRTGEIFADKDVLVMRGTLPSRELVYEARMAIITDGEKLVQENKLVITGATETTILYTLDTSYKLCPEVFLAGNNKAMGDDPHESVVSCLNSAIAKGWELLYNNHIKDYCALIGRVEFDLGGKEDGRSVEELIQSYQSGKSEPYLEELYYAYGRHLLVSSSRKGTLPATLQGVWTVHDESPWSCGYWHNINVQMNYWPAFNTNLTETFEAYAEYWKNYCKQAGIRASNWVKNMMPSNYVEGEGECGWIIGTGGWPYEIDGISPGAHSGPGTGGMTSKLFWDYYDFTRDIDVMKKYTYPAVHGMSKFFTKCVDNYDGRYLCKYSASPEQSIANVYPRYYRTVGCMFDQQFMYENAVDDLKCSQILGVEDETTNLIKTQLDGYGPVQIGYSGQIKEYDEEHFYGEIGEANHRHISQLVALTPGNTITKATPAWLDSAKLTLELRGDESTGWALAHRLNAWARAGDGNHAYLLLQNLLKTRTYPNLWDVHPPFQIDGNFGATAGMTEMVLQSHEGYISILPSLPDAWTKLSFKGLKARGNFMVDCDYENGVIHKLKITSVCGETLKLRYEAFDDVKVFCDGQLVAFEYSTPFVSFKTEVGKSYYIQGFKAVDNTKMVQEVSAKWETAGVSLEWNGNASSYAVYRAVGNESDYTLVATTSKRTYIDANYNINNKERLTYKIVSADDEYYSSQNGALAILHPATKLEEERSNLLFKVNNCLKM